MPFNKLCFYALLAAILVGAAGGTFSRYLRQSDVRETGAGPNDMSLAVQFPAKSERLPADFLRVQSRDADNLGAGKVLVASRNLGDPQFAKTVILLVRSDAQGVLGLVLNHRTDVPLSRVLEKLKAAKDRSDPVYVGGPVELPAVFALFHAPAKLEGAERVFDGVYLITAKTLLEKTMSSRPDPGVFHVYLGYTGWSPEQLRQEVELGAWFIFQPETSAVFNADPDSLWLKMIRRTEMQFARSEPANADVPIRPVQFAELIDKE
jgi:putative AlgH/UPF0301 family transcriptional regulator